MEYSSANLREIRREMRRVLRIFLNNTRERISDYNGTPRERLRAPLQARHTATYPLRMIDRDDFRIPPVLLLPPRNSLYRLASPMFLLCPRSSPATKGSYLIFVLVNVSRLNFRPTPRERKKERKWMR